MPTQKRSIKEIAAAARLRETTVVLSFAGDLHGQIEDLQRQLAAASDWRGGSLADADPRPELAERIEALQREMAENEAEFTVRALPARAWSDLLAAHPPRPGAEERFNIETFPAAAIAACCIDPVMTGAEYAELAQVLTAAQEDELFDAVWRVNTQAASVPFSLASSAILASLTAGK
ncbi:hypothetical protein [Kitasatospora sp. HPMI-4]|uniref:hypothetical protein n=1 Tax=Kitasatospora sp. HPMI-4 TaxID=3448443 RepID=UPI003F1A364B